MSKTVRIDADTARYYLRLESAFEKLATSLHVDPDFYLEVNADQRYKFRCDLHDSWEAAIAKPEYKRNRIQQRRGIS